MSQNSQENTCAKDLFLMKLQIYKVNNFIKKEIPAQIFSCEFCEISHNTLFLKNSSDGCFRINTRSVYCPTATFSFFKNDVTYISRLNLQSWNKSKLSISNPQPHSYFLPSRTSATEFFSKIVNSLKPLSIFAKKSSLVDVREDSKNASVSSHQRLQ